MLETELQIRAQGFCDKNGLLLDASARLGMGADGSVWKVAGATGGPSAVKVFERCRNYHAELDCYRILHTHGVVNVRGFNVPELVASDDELLVIQMTIVQPPYILDFGKAYCYSPPSYSDEVWEDYQQRFETDFGRDYEAVSLALSHLEGYGIFYVDANRRNINCEGLKPED